MYHNSHTFIENIIVFLCICTCASLVSATDGKTDVGVLGSQPGLSPHSPEGEEDPGEDVRVPRHQTVTESQERYSHQQRHVTATGTRPLTPASRRKGKKI